jgi:hypothetical protein
MRKKLIIIRIISLAFLGGLGYLVYVTYQNAQTKYLREAIAYEGVSKYEVAIAYCISAGYKVDSPLVAEFIYKIAKTYGMEGDYSSEKSTLQYLRNLSPEYRSKFILVRPVIR